MLQSLQLNSILGLPSLIQLYVTNKSTSGYCIIIKIAFLSVYKCYKALKSIAFWA